MKPRLWHVIAATIALAGALTAFGQPPMPNAVVAITNAQGQAVVVPVKKTNYIALSVTGISSNNGAKGYDYIPCQLQSTTNFKTWTTIYTVWTNGPFGVQVAATNPRVFYRWYWATSNAIRSGM